MISQETIEAVKQRANLVDVVSETIQLKRTGGRFVGLCPFHSEKSGSFHVREDENYFHCFGCGKSGNSISFIMETRGMTFPEAIEYLAEKFGIPITHEGKRYDPEKTVDHRKDIYAINAIAQAFFETQLQKRDAAVVAYVKERGLKREGFAAFHIGYASGGNELLKHLQTKKIPEDLLLKSGLIKRSDRGHLYDALRLRLTFPIFIDQKKIAGFGGRVIPSLLKADEKPPKYLNSPETPTYSKSEILYGLPQAIDAIRACGEVYVVEGYLDVIGLYQAGVANAVATCGTSLTQEHVKKLSRIAKRVIMLFDGDAAGKSAAGKSFKNFVNAPIDVWALYLPDKEDPDSMAKSYGDQTPKVLSEFPRIHLLDAFVDYLLGQQKVKSVSELGSQGLASLSDEVQNIIAQSENKTAKEDLIRRASHRLKVSEQSLSHPPKAVKVGSGDSSTEKNIGSPDIKELPLLDQEALQLIMGRKNPFMDLIRQNGNLYISLTSTTRSFIEELAEVVSLGGGDDVQKNHIKNLLLLYGPKWTAYWKESHRLLSFSRQKSEDLFKNLLKSLEKTQRDQLIKDLEAQAAAAPGNSSEEGQLRQQIVALRRGG